MNHFHPNSLNRRQFIQQSGLVTAGLALGASAAPGAARAGACLVTSRDTYLKDTGETDCWAAMAKLDVDGVEVEVNEEMICYSLKKDNQPYSLATDQDIKRLKADFASHAKVITSFCMHNKFDERPEKELAWAGQLVKAAEALGVGVIRIDVYPRKITGDQVLPFATRICRQLCALAEGTPVRFGIENHGKITNDPKFLEQLFQAVGSPKLGLTLDFMNFYWWGHPLSSVYGLFEQFASRAFHTHCKNLKYPEDKKNAERPMGWEYAKYAAPLYEGDIDYKRAAGILKKAGYRGDFCLENECLRHYPKEQQAEVLRKEIAWLRNVV